MANVKGFIFDLDGVIVSTDKYHYLGWKYIADMEGIYFDEIINDRLRGVSRMASLDIVLERANKNYTQDEKIKMAELKNAKYRELLNNLTPNDRLSGVTDTLNYLRGKGYKLAIGSSSKNTPLILKKIGLDKFFDGVSDGNNISHSKPHPEVFIKASEMINLKPENCVIIEDSRAGIEAGINGGFLTAAIGDAQKLKKADYDVNQIDDLIKLF